MDYPSHLLPSPKLKLIACDIGHFHLVRYTNTNKISEIIDVSTGLIKAAHICSPRENIIDLSTNLLGVFEYKNLEIELTEKGKGVFQHYCLPDILIEPKPQFQTDFSLNKTRGCWHILIQQINDIEVEYNVGNDIFVGKCKIMHTPMKWNYWHFSIRWILEDHEYWNSVDPRGKKKWSRRLAHTCRSHLQKFAKVEIPDYKVIHANNYLQ